MVRRGALPRKATVDAFHIGIAAAHQIEYLLGESLKVDEMVKELKKISGDTEAMRNTLNQIWVTSGRKP